MDASPAPPSRPLPRWGADACLLATTIIWGVNIPLFKYAIRHLDPWLFNAVRLAVATVALAILARLESRLGRPSVSRSDIANVPRGFSFSVARFLLFACLASLLYQWLFVLGIFRTTAGNTALLMASMPMWTATLSFVFTNERLPVISWCGLLVTFLGTAIITLSRNDVSLSSDYLPGNLLILTASLIWAAATILSRPLLSSMTSLQLAFWSSLVVLPLHVCVAGSAWSNLGALLRSPLLLGAVLFSGALSTGVAYAFWHVGVRHLGGSHASVYQNVVTLVAVVGGWLFLAEQPTAAQIAGGLLTLAGLFAVRRGRTAA